MTNYEGILRMNRCAMESFLDQVYIAGLNTGIYAATLPGESDEQCELLEKNPFDQEWLIREAEKAVSGEVAPDGDEYLLDALTEAVLRAAGIDPAEAIADAKE